MAKVYHRKARKDYPSNGIHRGDMYYTVSLKTGPRSSQTLRSLKPFRPSQLTSSAFKKGWFAAQETLVDEPNFNADTIGKIMEDIESIKEDVEGSFENMPENLQDGATGEMLQERINRCDDCHNELDSLKDSMEEFEDELTGDMEDRLIEYDGDEDDAMHAIETDRADLRAEVITQLEDMPD